MSEVLQTNIFFIITSIAVIVFTVFLCVALFYLIRILKHVGEMTERLRRGSEQLAEDAMEVRAFVKDGVIGNVKRFVADALGKEKPKARAHKKKDAEAETEEAL